MEGLIRDGIIFLDGGCGGSRQKMERKFLVLLRRYHKYRVLQLIVELAIHLLMLESRI